MGFNTTNKNGLKTTWGECGCDELRCVHWDNWDMTSIPRVAITDSMNEKETAIFERYNENCEATELLMIELEIERLEALEKQGRTSRYKDIPNRMGKATQWAYENRKITEELFSINDEEEYALFDNQGSTDAIRYDDDFDYDDSHR